MKNKDTIEIYFEEVILDSDIYENDNKDERKFEIGEFIVYFRGNFTWRAEVIKKTKTGYIVRDY